MEEFYSFPHGVISMPPDHEPYIATKKNPYETKDNSPELDKETDKSKPSSNLADNEPFITKSKNPNKTKNKSKNMKTDESKPSSNLAGFYAEDTVYGTVLAEIKKLGEQAFLLKGYMSSTFISHLRDLANKEAEARANDLPEELTDIENLLKLDLIPLDDYIAKKRNGEAVKLNNQFDNFIKIHGLEADVRSKYKFIRDHM